MKRFSITTDIDAPTERVWQVMSDTDRWHEWTPSIISVTRSGGESFAPGARFVVRQPKFPPAKWTVTGVEPGRSFTWVDVGPGIRVVAHHRVQLVDGGSRATLSLEFEGAVGGILAALTGKITKRYIALEARGLAARSENPAFRHSDDQP